jgi:hypothetical protein
MRFRITITLIAIMQTIAGILMAQKKPVFECRASMIFDMQKPVITNDSQKDFKPGKSTALMGGYSAHPGNLDNANNSSLALGINISNCMPFRNDLQWELFVSVTKSPEIWIGQMQPVDTIINSARVTGFTLLYELTKVTSFDIVPIKISYNLADFVHIGAGSLISLNAITTKSPRQEKYLTKSTNSIPFITEKKGNNVSEWFKGSDVALFLDALVGRPRRGPALGIRYLHCFKAPQNRLFFYASWSL